MARLTPKHDLINPDYFKQSLYFRFLERAFERENNRKLTNFECKTVQDTLGVLIRLSKTWSNYGKNIDDSFELNKTILKEYFEKYDYKNEMFIDEYCIELFVRYEEWLNEMEEIELKGKDKRCNKIKDEIITRIEKLDSINFDYIYNGYFYYKRNPSNKSKRGYVSLLNYDDVLDNFIKDFNNENKYCSIVKNERFTQQIKKIYNSIAELSQYLSKKEYEEINSVIVDNLFINCLPKRLDYWEYLCYDFKHIITLILSKKYDDAYLCVIHFIEENNKWFVRCS